MPIMKRNIIFIFIIVILTLIQPSDSGPVACAACITAAACIVSCAALIFPQAILICALECEVAAAYGVCAAVCCAPTP